MPNEDYHRGEWQKEFISSTSMKNYLVSPKYFDYVRRNPKPISLDAALMGSAYHSMLESMVNNGCIDAVYDEYFIFNAPINPRTGAPYGSKTKEYLNEYALQMENSGGKTPISQEEMETAQEMVNALLNDCGNTSEMVNHLINIGSAEVSFFCEYEGVKFKFRTDLKTKNKIVDWKTIAADDLHESTIARQIEKMHYGFSAAFYQFFNHQITGEWNEFLWVFQQKTAPYDAVVVSASDYAYSQDFDGNLVLGPSALEFENILNAHIKFSKEGRYPGAEIFIPQVDDTYRIMYSMPNYKRNNFQTIYNI